MMNLILTWPSDLNINLTTELWLDGSRYVSVSMAMLEVGGASGAELVVSSPVGGSVYLVDVLHDGGPLVQLQGGGGGAELDLELLLLGRPGPEPEPEPVDEAEPTEI